MRLCSQNLQHLWPFKGLLSLGNGGVVRHEDTGYGFLYWTSDKSNEVADETKGAANTRCHTGQLENPRKSKEIWPMIQAWSFFHLLLIFMTRQTRGFILLGKINARNTKIVFSCQQNIYCCHVFGIIMKHFLQWVMPGFTLMLSESATTEQSHVAVRVEAHPKDPICTIRRRECSRHE